jgi:hypothetical protein
MIETTADRGDRKMTDKIYGLPHGNDSIAKIGKQTFFIRQEPDRTYVASQRWVLIRPDGWRSHNTDITALLPKNRYALSQRADRDDLCATLRDHVLPLLEQYRDLFCPHCLQWIGDPENSDIAAISRSHDLDRCVSGVDNNCLGA